MTLTGIINSIVQFLRDVTGSDGLAIIALTILLKVVTYPLTVKQTKAMEEMKLLQPKVKEIQEKYKSQPEEMQKRVMELYREHKVNPLGGCWPTLIQLPIIWALFTALRNYPFEQRFLWMPNLGKPDVILAVLAGAATYLQSIMMSTDPSQKMMNLIMPAFIIWISLSFPAGVTLYWVVTTLLAAAQQWWMGRRVAQAGLVVETVTRPRKGSVPKATSPKPRDSEGESGHDTKR
ncbi:MAG: YidC/Oxa1 family membrane protein insertase [Firmicutes bacterium]|nr:YidC/Oxa1 family membrane protein insertase [Bacillota bacterium]MDH7495860.1 YidC/Oxa1 family membrane protein insertase [Bacillota bacterium]